MSEKMILKDSFGRVVTYLRLSITDRCNFRCFYCKPIKEFRYLPHSEMLSFEELYFLLKTLKKYGVTKIRLTGGEPFVKHGFMEFLSEVSKIIPSVHITTNGYFLKNEIDTLVKIGIKSINISLDTLSSEKFIEITKVNALNRVLEGIKAAAESNIKTKINTVIMKKNLIEVIDLISFANNLEIPIRFIELMPISSEVRKQFVSESTVKNIISKKYKMEREKNSLGIGPSIYYRIENKQEKGVIGFISAMTHNFCENCDKIRITSDGKLRVCLASDEEVSLKKEIQNREEEGLIKLIKMALDRKPEKHNMNIYKQKTYKAMFQIGG
jgi:cyclic pyranopterin phosphate synthase